MQIGFRALIGASLGLALFAGDLSTLSLTPTAAHAQWRGGGAYGGGGYRGGYRDYGYRGRGAYYGGGIGFGDFLLGAAIIGGAAAIISSNNRRNYDSYPVYDAPPPGYAPYYAPSAAEARPGQHDAAIDPVEQCSRAAVGEAAANGDNGRVLSVDQVVPHENGARVTGTLEVTKRNRSTERARFTCTADYGQVTGFRFG